MKNSITKKICIVLISSALITSQNAFAARLGKSRSLGMQRSNISTQSTRSNNYNGQNNGYRSNNNYNPQPNVATGQKKGYGVGAVVAGAAAGAVGGYMLGKAMNSNEPQQHNTTSQQATTQNNNVQTNNEVNQQAQPTTVSNSQAQTPATPPASNSLPWGLIGVLVGLLILGLMFFRKKTMPQTNETGTLINQNRNNDTFEIPNIGQNSNYTNQNQMSNNNNANNTSNFNINNDKMVDGIETQYFLRQAKGMFLHIQSMNTPDNVSEVEKYLTPQLYNELKSIITSNDYVADFNPLDCRLIDSSIENNNYIASVHFYGKVSDSPSSPSEDFNEIWHFIKPLNQQNAKWVVAGIQQTN